MHISSVFRIVIMVMMTATLLALLLCDDPKPEPAEFIPAHARDYFECARGEQYWGPETRGWRFGLSPFAGPWHYVAEGGRGEALEVRLCLYTPKGDIHVDALRVTIRVGAEKLPDYVQTETIKPIGSSANSYGSSWMLSLPSISLRALEQKWGRLPERVTLSVSLAQDGIPPASTPAVPIGIESVPRAKSTWSDLVRSLRVGQTREEVESLLGRPDSARESRRQGWGTGWTLLYPLPDAPADWPAELRRTQIDLDAQGRFLLGMLHGGC